MKKIVYLPLDERPCNALFPVRLFGDVFDIAAPSAVGFKKQAVSWEDLRDFLDREAPGADGLVLSMDMLLYGGLIPSRLHHLDRETVLDRMNYIRTLRQRNPSMVIYAYQCIMRCPQYSSSDEEPDYYGECGREIFLLGEARHRRQLGLEDGGEEARLSALVPTEALQDYLDRRAFNLSFNLEALELVREGVIDELVFPQDDAARYGFTAQDQERVRARISELRLNTRVLLYPGADELGLTIMSRMLLHFENRHPLVYVKMASVNAASVIPPFEDRPLGETIKYHLISAGCRLASSVSEAEIVLGVSFPGCAGLDILAAGENAHGYAVERNLIEFLLFLEEAMERGKVVTLADNAYANGGDPELISLLEQKKMLDRLHGYSGWNTSSNTMGTAIAMGVHALIRGITPAHRNFLAQRYLEDAGYCGKVRTEVMRDDLPRMGYDYYNIGPQRGEVSELVGKRLRAYLRSEMSSIADQIEILDVWMPWKRAFEVGLEVRWNGEARK